jgi:hypothetical protein
VRLELSRATGVMSFDRSQSYDQSRVFRPESSIRPELRLLTGVGHMTGVASSNRSHIFRPESGIRTESGYACIMG